MASVNAAGPVSVQAQSARLVENGAGTYQADFSIPAGATIIDIIVEAVAVWAAATSALLDIGDSGAAQGWLAALNVKTTPAAGNSFSIASTQTRYGAGGSYVTAATSTSITRGWSASPRTITAKIVSTGAGATGNTRVTVVYAVGNETVVTQ
jgi:hypothetical protein